MALAISAGLLLNCDTDCHICDSPDSGCVPIAGSSSLPPRRFLPDRWAIELVRRIRLFAPQACNKQIDSHSTKLMRAPQLGSLLIHARLPVRLHRHPDRVTRRRDLLPDFRTIDRLRDWLPIRGEQCAKRVLPNGRWWQSSARRIANRFSGVAKRHGGQRTDDLHLAQAVRRVPSERGAAPQAARGRECSTEEVGCRTRHRDRGHEGSRGNYIPTDLAGTPRSGPS